MENPPQLDPFGMVPGAPRPGGPENQQNMSPELRERYERGGALPVEGMDLLENLQSAEIGERGDISELRDAIDEALAFKEGLEMGFTGAAYEFNPTETHGHAADKQKIANLQKLFTTVEGATARPNPTYLDIAINEAVQGRIRRAQDWHRNPQKYLNRFKSEYTRLNRALIRNGQKPLEEDEVQMEIQRKAGDLQNEFTAIPALVELSNYVQARGTFDVAFRYRMQTCENPKEAAALGNDTKTVTPDGPDWMGYFQGKETGDFGDEVNAVFEEIIKFGLPEDKNPKTKMSITERLGMKPIPSKVRDLVPESIYADGFKSGVIFGVWMNHLLEVADGRMDIVWSAWKMALTTEVIDTLGQTIDKVKEVYVLASPPYGNSLFSFINHLPEKRAIELGLKVDGTRNQTEIYISHGGLPMSAGDHKDKNGNMVPIFPSLCSDYLHESKIKFDAEGLSSNSQTFITLLENLPNPGDPDWNPSYAELRKNLEGFKNGKKADGTQIKKEDNIEIALWDIWLYGRISFADLKFPWFQTDQPDHNAVPNELPPGNMGSWFLTRGRANGIVEDLKSQPTLGELGDPLFFVKRVRNWAKVLGKIKDERPEDNPRNWWIMGILHLHTGKAGQRAPIVKEKPEGNFQISNRKEEIEIGGATSTTGISTGDILENAIRCGFIRETDREWLKKKLVI